MSTHKVKFYYNVLSDNPNYNEIQKKKIIGKLKNKYMSHSSLRRGEVRQQRGKRYIHIYVTVIILKIKLLGREQALTNIKVRRNVIPRRQMRLFNLFAENILVE